MFKVPLADLKEKILLSGKLTSSEFDVRIKQKINELSGLISEEGAAHIIANELGIELANTTKSKLKIKEIYAGMKAVTTVGKVVRKFDVREFAKGDNKGRVCSLIMGDETGTIRVVFWNDQVMVAEKIKEDDIISIKEGYVKENNAQKEVHLGERATVVVNPPGEIITNVRQAMAAGRKKISELISGDEGVEVLGTVVQVFDPRFFTTCSQCNKRAVEEAGGFRCSEHGIVQPQQAYVMNVVLDDGTGTIRSIFWRNQTNHLLGKEESHMIVYKENLSAFEEVKTDLLGEQLKLIGRVQRNEMFDRLEFNVQLVEKAKPEEELVRVEKS